MARYKQGDHRPRPQRKTKNKISVELPSHVVDLTDENAEEDELTTQTARSKQVERKHVSIKKRRISRAPIVVPYIVPTQVLALQEKVQAMLDEGSFEDGERIRNLQEQCERTSNFLRARNHPDPEHRGLEVATRKEYGEWSLCYLEGKVFSFSRPVDVFQGTGHLFKREKIVGLVLHKGDPYPLAYAISGHHQCTEEHPRLLDNKKWTTIVLEFARYNCQKIPYYWDKAGDGMNTASHAEKQLMMFFALSKVKEILKIDGPLENLRADLPELKAELKASRRKIEAEIILPRLPCSNCKAFGDVLSKRCGIIFTFTECKTTGEIKRERKNGVLMTALYATVSDEDMEDEDEDVESEIGCHQVEAERRHRTVEIVLPSTPTSEKRVIRKESSKSIIRSFRLESSKLVKGYDSSNDSDYCDPESKCMALTTTRLPKTRSSAATAYPSPTSPALFGEESRAFAKGLLKNKKRKANLHDSPSKAKKARIDKAAGSCL